MSTIIVPLNKWNDLKTKLQEEYGAKIFVGFISRQKLGCSFRTHYLNVHWESTVIEYDIRIDFYNESKKTWFLIKYSEFL